MEIDTKKLAEEIHKEQPVNYWSIGAFVLGVIACLIATTSIFIKPKKES